MADFSKTGALALVIEQVLLMFSDFAMSISATPPCVFHYCPLMEGTNSPVKKNFVHCPGLQLEWISQTSGLSDWVMWGRSGAQPFFFQSFSSHF